MRAHSALRHFSNLLNPFSSFKIKLKLFTLTPNFIFIHLFLSLAHPFDSIYFHKKKLAHDISAQRVLGKEGETKMKKKKNKI
jgi:hypothetical protein